MAKEQRVIAQVLERDFACPVCEHAVFYVRQVALASRRTVAFGRFASAESVALICEQCGHVDEFVGDALQMFEPPVE